MINQFLSPTGLMVSSVTLTSLGALRRYLIPLAMSLGSKIFTPAARTPCSVTLVEVLTMFVKVALNYK